MNGKECYFFYKRVITRDGLKIRGTTKQSVMPTLINFFIKLEKNDFILSSLNMGLISLISALLFNT